MKFIKVMQIPGRTTTVEIADGASDVECAQAAGFETQGYQITNSATSGNVPEDGGSVVLTRQVKGA
jgi:hypothetical protein